LEDKGRGEEGKGGEFNALEQESSRVKPLKVPAARWWCSHSPAIDRSRGGTRGLRATTVVLAEAGHCAILSAIETGTRCWTRGSGGSEEEESPVVDGGFRARRGKSKRVGNEAPAVNEAPG